MPVILDDDLVDLPILINVLLVDGAGARDLPVDSETERQCGE